MLWPWSCSSSYSWGRRRWWILEWFERERRKRWGNWAGNSSLHSYMRHFFSLYFPGLNSFFYNRWGGSNGQGTFGNSSSLCTWVGGGGRVLVLIIFSWLEGRRVSRLSRGYLVSYSSFLGWRVLVLVLITLFWLEGREGSTLVGMVW